MLTYNKAFLTAGSEQVCVNMNQRAHNLLFIRLRPPTLTHWLPVLLIPALISCSYLTTCTVWVTMRHFFLLLVLTWWRDSRGADAAISGATHTVNVWARFPLWGCQEASEALWWRRRHKETMSWKLRQYKIKNTDAHWWFNAGMWREK